TRSHAEAVRLSELHDTADRGDYLRGYFDHQYAKGKEMVDRFAALTREWEGGRALDFGCGAGGLTYRLRERSREAVGIDLDLQKLAFASAQAARLGVTGV